LMRHLFDPLRIVSVLRILQAIPDCHARTRANNSTNRCAC
jgi:hypothetical protein